MKIHEYQGKEVLAQYGVAVPRGHVAFTPDEAVAAAEKLGGELWVVKAQIHAGGRGKGGGVKLARSLDEVRTLSDEILGMQLITHQTGPEGQLVRRVYIEEGADIARELYLGVVLDREKSQLCFMASTEGGTEIEEVAETHPGKILKEWVDPMIGLAVIKLEASLSAWAWKARPFARLSISCRRSTRHSSRTIVRWLRSILSS